MGMEIVLFFRFDTNLSFENKKPDTLYLHRAMSGVAFIVHSIWLGDDDARKG